MKSRGTIPQTIRDLRAEVRSLRKETETLRAKNILLAESEELQERVRQLEEALSPSLPLTWNLPLSAYEARALDLLFRRSGIVTRDALHLVMRGVDSNSDPVGVSVHMRNLRRIVRPSGIEIKNCYGKGYYLTPASRAQLAAMIGQHDQAPAVRPRNASHQGGEHALDA